MEDDWRAAALCAPGWRGVGCPRINHRIDSDDVCHPGTSGLEQA